MVKNRNMTWDEYHRTGETNSNFNLNNREEIASITGWSCARDNGRANAFCNYYCTGVNCSEYDLKKRNRMMSVLDGIKYHR